MANISNPEGLLDVAGTDSTLLSSSHKLMAHIDFRKAKLRDGSSAWYDVERPLNAEYGSGIGVLKWCPKLLSGNYVVKAWSEFVPDTTYEQTTLVNYGNNVYIWRGDSWEIAGTPGVDIGWELVAAWNNELESYSMGSYVRHAGKFWQCVPYDEWTSEFAQVGVAPGDTYLYDDGWDEYPVTDWYQVQEFTTTAIPTAYVPASAAEVLTIETFMGANGVWSGMLTIGNYFLNSRFVGTFDFNGYEILNMYMDCRTTNALAVSGTLPNLCVRIALFARMGANASTGLDKFLGSTPSFRNACVMSAQASSVVISHDADSYAGGSPDMTGGVRVVDSFVLSQRNIVALAFANMPYMISGKSEVSGKVVCEMLSEPGIPVLSSAALFTGTFSGWMGGNVTRATIGDVKAEGTIVVGRASFVGGLISRIEPGDSTTIIDYGNIDLEVDIVCAGISATAVAESIDSIGMLFGRIQSKAVNTAATHTFKAILCKGSLSVATVGGQAVYKVSGLIGILGAYNTVLSDGGIVLINTLEGPGDENAVIGSGSGTMTQPIVYYNSNSETPNYAGEAVPLTLAEMKERTSFTELDFNNVWKMKNDNPIPQSFDLVIKQALISGGMRVSKLVPLSGGMNISNQFSNRCLTNGRPIL